jgi:hypothetical protein
MKKRVIKKKHKGWEEKNSKSNRVKKNGYSPPLSSRRVIHLDLKIQIHTLKPQWMDIVFIDYSIVCKYFLESVQSNSNVGNIIIFSQYLNIPIEAHFVDLISKL